MSHKHKVQRHKLLGFVLFMALLGIFYDYLTLATRTWVLPLAIIAAVAYVETRFKQLEYEARVFNIKVQKIQTQQFSLVDDTGRERVSLFTSLNSPEFTLYDQDHTPRASLKLAESQPLLELKGQKARAVIEFNDNGLPSLIFRDETENIIWSAP
ncbi:MAG: hypothetical protein ACLFVT_00265 [Syntrophobacteria bacterium]